MPRNYTLRRKFTLRSREYLICGRAGPRDAVHVKLCETGAGGVVLTEMNVSLDTAFDVCDRLAEYDEYYHAYRPLPAHDALLKSTTLANEDGTYLLELAVLNYRQCFTMSQDRERRTRSAPPLISVPDMGRFRRELAEAAETMAAACVPLYYWLAGGVTKVVRGNRTAVLWCPVAPWPWCHSEQTERLLFEPELVRMILEKHDARAVQEYCERRYPDLVTRAYDASPDADSRTDGHEHEHERQQHQQQRRVLDEFKCLSVRWVRLGAEFRVNRPTLAGTGVVLRHEDHWYTA